MLAAQIVARDWLARRMGGAIVNASSMAAKLGFARHTAYCASMSTAGSRLDEPGPVRAERCVRSRLPATARAEPVEALCANRSHLGV